MAWYSESFIFLVMTMCAGGVMAVLGGVGCFVLAMLDKDESTGEVQIGRFFNVKGVSLIMLSVCGVGLMGFSVYSWTQLQSADAYDPMLELGYFDEGEWDEAWDGEEYAEGDDADVVETVVDEPTAVEGEVVDIPHYVAVEDLGPPEDIGDDDTMDLSLLLRELEALEYMDELIEDDDTEWSD
jgi:hypothetical protein